MSKIIEKPDWSTALLKNGGKLIGSANYHLELLRTENIYSKWKKDFYKAHNIASLLKKIK